MRYQQLSVGLFISQWQPCQAKKSLRAVRLCEPGPELLRIA
jgi:hypothetical protein